MIMSDSFVKSQQARDNELTTNSFDHPVIVQFAANNAKDFADATELVYKECDGVDLNCGCPQRYLTNCMTGLFIYGYFFMLN